MANYTETRLARYARSDNLDTKANVMDRKTTVACGPCTTHQPSRSSNRISSIGHYTSDLGRIGIVALYHIPSMRSILNLVTSPSSRHVDLNIPTYLSHGHGANIIQGSVSLDDETEHGCTKILPGLHKRIGEWWEQANARVKVSDGPIHGRSMQDSEPRE